MSTNNNNQKNKFSYLLTAIIITASTIAWSTLHMSIHLDIDIAWLLQCLERFIAGGTYTDDFYETNPPLSFLIYLPAYPLYALLGLNTKFSILLLFFVYIATSNAALFKLLQKTSLSQSTLIAICCATITAQTWGTGISFGLKDHLILVFLTPFLLMQYLTTMQRPQVTPALQVICTVMGGIALCLKPHYAILPLALYIHRLISSKSLKKCILSIDTIGLITCGIAYITFIYLVTPEYFQTILPEASKLYSIETPFPITLHLKLFAITIIATFIGLALPLGSKHKDIHETKNTIIIFASLSALCIIPFMLQNKGFYYHAAPFLGFGVSALAMATYGTCRLIIKNNLFALTASLILVAMLMHANTKNPASPVMNNNQFKAQPIAEFIEENAWNDVYITYDMKSMLSPLPYLIDKQNGSRFGQLWNMHALSLLSAQAQNDKEIEHIKTQMRNIVDMMAEDIEKNVPSVIAIPLYPKGQNDHEPTQMYFEFLMSSDKFSKIMQNYTKETRVPFNKSLTVGNNNPKNIIWHDMYILNKSHNL